MSRKVLIIQAHPDDADFNIGGTVAKWADEGQEIYYLIITDGSKGTFDPEMEPDKLARIREKEQLEAARILGVQDVIFLRYRDGELILPSLELREKLIRAIRKLQVDVVCTLDPWMEYNAHPDHRIAGLVASEAAVFAGMPSFNREHLREGIKPKQVSEIYYFATDKPNLWIDVSDYVERKMKAILAHRSQIEMLGALARRTGDAERLGITGSDYDIGCEIIKRRFSEIERRIKEGEKYLEEFRVLGVGAGHLKERGFRLFPSPRVL